MFVETMTSMQQSTVCPKVSSPNVAGILLSFKFWSWTMFCKKGKGHTSIDFLNIFLGCPMMVGRWEGIGNEVFGSVVVKTLACHHYSERPRVQISSRDTLCM